MKSWHLILLSLLACGCSPSDSNNNPEEKPKPSAAKQAVERATGKHAVKQHKHTQNILGDVEAKRDERHKDLQKFRQD